MYVDGRGWVEGAARWAYYCPACQDHHETELLNQTLDKMRNAIHQRDAERKHQSKSQCEHWLERCCSMSTYTGTCCACADRRSGTRSELYPAYVDGEGWVTEATRWAYYCPGCKDFESSLNYTASVSTEAEPKLVVQAKPVDQSSTNQRFSGQCRHYATWKCSLTSTNGKCCACSDARQESKTGLYDAYVDGAGWVEEAARWASYCPGCVRNYGGDSQSNAPSYTMYVDGSGWVMGALRWTYYCPGCKNIFIYDKSFILDTSSIARSKRSVYWRGNATTQRNSMRNIRQVDTDKIAYQFFGPR
ncbi:hypothetical protein JX266_007590 [Neoarthrinium moseri]|nr:hypothetical protein JX266_007590 [Neoarthrinium moseri]